MLDYDGTLAPIRQQPKLALLSPRRKAFLRRLASQPGIKLAIISGRKLADIKKLVGLRNIIYVGNHGLEIEAGGRRWIHPAAKKFSPILKKIGTALSKRLRFPGLRIEDKGLTLSVHYRSIPRGNLARLKKDFREAVEAWKNKIRVTRGKMVFEIRPPVKWGKGKAVKWLVKKLKLGGYFPVYFGDDRTDEDAFRSLRRKGLTFRVGPAEKTLARERLRDVAAVYRFLLYFSAGRC